MPSERVQRGARIGVNALYLIPGGVGGTEIYLRELLAALARIDSTNKYFVFTNQETGQDLVPAQTNFCWKPQAVRAAFRPGRILWEQIILPIEAARCGLDAIFNPGFTAPLLSGTPQVTTFHDLQHLRHPEYFRWFDLPFWRFLLWTAAHRSRGLIAVSESTRDDLLRHYTLSPKKITVALHGVNPEFFSLDRSHPEPFLLCVSTLHPHKNIERLIRAYASRPRANTLVLAGMRGFHAAPIEKLIKDLKVENSVRITGWLRREELLRLFQRAWAFVYPSTFEGFGMPVLEAMAASIPVACSDIAPLREVAGDAALLFSAEDEESIGNALDLISGDQDLRCKLATAGRERARIFTWQRSAEITLEALLSAASHR